MLTPKRLPAHSGRSGNPETIDFRVADNPGNAHQIQSTQARLSVLIRRITLQIALDECYALKATASQGRLPGKTTIRPSDEQQVSTQPPREPSKGTRVEPAQYGIEHEAIDDVHDVILFEDIGNGQTKLTFIGNETIQNAMKRSTGGYEADTR